MGDDKAKRKEDAKRVNIHQSYELKRWAKVFVVPEWAVVLAVWQLDRCGSEPTRENVLSIFECNGLEVSRAKKTVAAVHRIGRKLAEKRAARKRLANRAARKAGK